MNEHETLTAYLATLCALVIVFVAALVAAALAPALVGKLEVFGLGTITGGLIGALRTPIRQTPAANVEKADTVNQSPAPAER